MMGFQHDEIKTEPFIILHYVIRLYSCSACHVTGKQLKMLSHETVHQNRIKLVATEKA